MIFALTVATPPEARSAASGVSRWLSAVVTSVPSGSSQRYDSAQSAFGQAELVPLVIVTGEVYSSPGIIRDGTVGA